MTDTVESAATIDSREATCPGLLMDLIGTENLLEFDTVVKLQTTARNATTDVPGWLEVAGHDLLEDEARDDYWDSDIEVN